MTRKTWTAADRVRVKFYAEEGLSLSRTSRQLGVSPGQLSNFASREGIKFSGEMGAPYGNRNRTSGREPRTEPERREANRLRTQQARLEGRWRKAGDIQLCSCCGGPILFQRSKVKFCSNKCKRRFQRHAR